MQSETADFALGAATWRTGRNICIVFDSGPFALLCENVTSSTKPEVHTLTSKEEGATNTGFLLLYFIAGRGPAYFWTSALRPRNGPVC